MARTRGWAFAPATVLVVLAAVLAGCTPDPADSLDGGSPHPVPTDPPSSLPTITPGASGGPTGLIEVSPYIVFAGPDPDGTTVSASGAVDGLLETGATCTFVFTPASGDPVTLESTSNADATYTSCGVVTDSSSRFAAGTWKVVLEYLSANAAGQSRSVTMEVP